jgi:hypothetical protein
MHMLNSATMACGGAHAAPPKDDVPDQEGRIGTSAMPQAVIYLDPRPFTRDCIGGWLQSSLSDPAVLMCSSSSWVSLP